MAPRGKAPSIGTWPGSGPERQPARTSSASSRAPSAPRSGHRYAGARGSPSQGGGALSEARLAPRWLAAALVLGMAIPGWAEPGTSDAAPRGTGEPGASAPATAGTAAPGRVLLDTAWRDGGATLAERSKATRAAALQLGIWSLDPAARAILHDTSLGSPTERAEAAALLAPELPDAALALAGARLRSVDPVEAFDAALAAVVALDRHPEASPWFRATALDAVARSALLAGLLFLFVAGLGTAAALALPLAVRMGIPAASAAAGLGALLLVPAALGEGAARHRLRLRGARHGAGSPRVARRRGRRPAARDRRSPPAGGAARPRAAAPGERSGGRRGLVGGARLRRAPRPRAPRARCAARRLCAPRPRPPAPARRRRRRVGSALPRAPRRGRGFGGGAEQRGQHALRRGRTRRGARALRARGQGEPLARSCSSTSRSPTGARSCSTSRTWRSPRRRFSTRVPSTP